MPLIRLVPRAFLPVLACAAACADPKSTADAETGSSNAPPVVNGVQLSPPTADTDDPVTATVAVMDPDGTVPTLSYVWFVNDARVLDGASNTLEGTAFFDRDDVVYVEVTADDGIATDTRASDPLTVGNARPTAPVVALGPEGARGGDGLLCEIDVASADADGDAFAYTFAWEVDGAPFEGASGGADRSEVPGTATATGQQWTCRVTVTDALGGRSEGAAERTIE